jgi:hypothetical protein
MLASETREKVIKLEKKSSLKLEIDFNKWWLAKRRVNDAGLKNGLINRIYPPTIALSR